MKTMCEFKFKNSSESERKKQKRRKAETGQRLGRGKSGGGRKRTAGCRVNVA